MPVLHGSSNAKNNYGSFLVIAAVVAILAVGGYFVLNAPDQRTTGEKIGDAVDQLPNGVDKAARELEDRSPGERLGDAIKDTGDKVKESTDQ